MNTEHLDEDTLHELQLIMGDDFSRLVQTFTADSVARIAAIRETATADDAEALRRAAHSFKGSSGNMGARQLSELCRLIEEYARDGSVDACLPLIAALDDEFDVVQRELQRFH